MIFVESLNLMNCGKVKIDEILTKIVVLVTLLLKNAEILSCWTGAMCAKNISENGFAPANV